MRHFSLNFTVVVVVSSVRPTDEDDEILVTLTEALDALTKDYITQVPYYSHINVTSSQAVVRQ